MAAITVAELRARVVAILLTVEGWEESRMPADLFPGDTRQYAAHAFAVDCPTTRWASDVESSRTRRTSGGHVETAIRVRWSVRLRADDAINDYDQGLAAEEALYLAVLAASQVDVHFLLRGLARQARNVDGELWLIGELTFAAQHLVSLS